MATKLMNVREMPDYIRAISGKARKASARALLRTAVDAEKRAKQNTRTVFTGTRERPKQGFLMNAIFAGFVGSGSGSDRRVANAFVAVSSRKGSGGTRPYGRIHEYGGRIVPKKAKRLWLPLTGPKTTGAAAQFKNLNPRGFMAFKQAQGASGSVSLSKTKKRKDEPANTRRVKQAHRTGLKAFVQERQAAEKRRGKKPKGKAKGSTATRLRERSAAQRATFGFIPGELGPVAGVTIKRGRGKTARAQFIALFQLRSAVTMPKRPYVGPAVAAAVERHKARLDKELAASKQESP